MDIDESGYFCIALNDYYNLIHNGIAGFIRTVDWPGIQAPLQTATTALLFYATGAHIVVGLFVPLFATVLTIAASYWIGSTLGSPEEGLLSATLVASCPVIINYSRSYQFAAVATCVATIALLALLRSNHFRHFIWASIFGVFLGLMPLARTMTIAFVPGFLAAAFVDLLLVPNGRGKRFLTLIWSLALALAVASTWLGPNWHYVFNYLFNYGYGDHAAQYGKTVSRFGLADWLTLAQTFVTYIYIPHFVILSAGALSMLWLAGRRVLEAGAKYFFCSLPRRRILPLILFTAEASVALASSQNIGTAFIAPIIPAMMVLTVWFGARAPKQKAIRVAMAAGVVLVAIATTLPSISLNSRIAKPWWVDVPVLGPQILLDGRGAIQRYEAAGGYGSLSPAEPIDATTGKAWVDASEATAAKLRQLSGTSPVAAFGFNHFLFNTGSVTLQEFLVGKGVAGPGLVAVDRVVTGDSVSGDTLWLTHGNAQHACVLLTTGGGLGMATPEVDENRVVEAAKQIGFNPVDRLALPDGRDVIFWQRKTVESGCD